MVLCKANDKLKCMKRNGIFVFFSNEPKISPSHSHTYKHSFTLKIAQCLIAKPFSSFQIRQQQQQQKQQQQRTQKKIQEKNAKRYDNHKIDKTKLKESLTCTCSKFRLYQLILYVMHIRNASTNTNTSIRFDSTSQYYQTLVCFVRNLLQDQMLAFT